MVKTFPSYYFRFNSVSPGHLQYKSVTFIGQDQLNGCNIIMPIKIFYDFFCVRSSSRGKNGYFFHSIYRNILQFLN